MKAIELIGDATSGGGPAIRTFDANGARYYVAQKGDTYWSIASDELGSAARAEDLWLAQSEGFRRDHGGTMNRLGVGDILRLPEERTAMHGPSAFADFYRPIGDLVRFAPIGDGTVEIPTITVTGNSYSDATNQAATDLVAYLNSHPYAEHEQIPQVGVFQRAFLVDGGTLKYGADEEYGPETQAALQTVLTSLGAGSAPAVVAGGGTGPAPTPMAVASKVPWGGIAAAGAAVLAVGVGGYAIHRMSKKRA